MADQLDDDRDEEWFKEVYGTEYTGPPRAGGSTRRVGDPPPPKAANKRVSNLNDSEEDDEPRDPNAVPTDFTSREARVWEAKAKAIERNWKRRKEEELTCRLCGEVGHFAQGCPTTLGGNRKLGEVVERIPLRDKRLKPRLIGTGGAIIQGIEKDSGCRLKLEDNLTIANGAFFVKITGPDRIAVNKAVSAVTKLVDQVEDEWKQQSQSAAWKPSVGDRERGAGAYRGGGAPTVNPLIAAQMQHIAVQRQQHESNTMGGPGRWGDLTSPPLDEEKRTIEHIASQLEARRQWETASGSSQQSLNGSYKEGRSASGAGSLPPPLTGKVDGGSTFYPDSSVSYPNQAEQDLEMNLEYDAQNLDELECRFLEETIELTKDQNKEEDKENALHRERLREIQEQFQHKMTKLRVKQAKQREEFLCREAQMRYQTPSAQTYSHYQYGGAGGASAPSVRPPSGYSDALSSRPVSAYTTTLSPYEGKYDTSYEKASMVALPDIQPSLHESYSETSYSSGRTPPYNNSKQGFEKPGHDSSSAYNKSQVYDMKSYSHGTTAQYPAYG